MRAVLVIEYDVADEAPFGALHEAMSKAIKGGVSAPGAPEVTAVSVHAAIHEVADRVLAVIEEGQ